MALDSLAPLDLANVDTLLDHLPKWTHVPEPVDDRDNSLDDEVDLGFGGESANTESEGGMGHVLGCAQRSEDIRWFERSRRAGRSRR